MDLNYFDKISKTRNINYKLFVLIYSNFVQRNGFFIEAGAWDGEQLSNTIYMETQLGWTGLLVEPNKPIFDILVNKKRNAYSVNSCLSRNRYAEQVNFDTADVYGAIEDPR